MSQFKPKIEHLPTLGTEYQMSMGGMTVLLQGELPDAKLHLWDRQYWYVSLEDWGKVFDKVLSGMPKYTITRFDCENFALLASARTAELFKLNTCALVIGDSPRGYHGFNLFIADVDGVPRIYILEPQDSMVYSIKEHEGYKPEIILIG